MTMATAFGSILTPTNAAAEVDDDVNEERAQEEGYRFVDRGAATHRIEIDAAIDADAD